MWFYQCPACFDLLRRRSSLRRPMSWFSPIFHMFLQNFQFFFPHLFYSPAHNRTRNITPVVAPVTAFPLPSFFGWMIPPPAGHPPLARRPAKPKEGFQDCCLSPLSHAYPTSLSALRFFILHPPDFCCCSSALPSFQPST